MDKDLEDLKILIVDDNKQTIDLVRSILIAQGLNTISIAYNGAEAFQKFCEDQHDLIISDWSMTPVNGIELTIKIRQSPESPDPYVPILLLTASTSMKQVQTARDAGVNEFLIKPFNAKNIYNKII